MRPNPSNDAPNKTYRYTEQWRGGRGGGARGTGHGARGTGHGARGTGHGARSTGHGARGTGHGARGTGHGALKSKGGANIRNYNVKYLTKYVKSSLSTDSKW